MSSRDAAAAAAMSSSDQQQQQPQRRRRRRRQREAAQEQQHNSSNSSSSSSSDDGDTTTNVKQRRIDEAANAHSECAAAATAVVERTDELVRSLAAASGEALTAVLSQWQTAEQRCREAATRHTTLSQQLVRTHAAHAEAAMAQHTLHAQLQLQTHAAATLQQQLQRSAAEAVADVWPRLTAMLQSPLQSLQTRVAAERALADALCRHARDVAQHAMTAMHAAAQRALRAELRVTEGAVSLTRLQAAYTHEQSRRIRHDAETAALLRIVAALTLRVRHGNADATALRRARAHVRALERRLSLRDVGAAVAAAHEAGAHDDVDDAVDSSSSSSNGVDTHTNTATAAALHAVDSNDSSSADGDVDVPMPPRALRARTPQYYALRVLAHHKMTLCELVEAWSTQASRLAAADARDAALQQRVRAVQHDAGVVQARYVAEKLRREAAERRLSELMLERWGVADTSTTAAAATATAAAATTSLHSSQAAACPAGLLREVHTLREQCNTLRDDAAQHAVALAQARDEAARAQHAADALRTRVAQLEADVRGDDVAAALSQLRADYVEACDSMQRRCVDSETQLRLLATLAEERGSALQQALAALTRMRHDVAAAYTQQQQQQQSNTATSSNNKKGSTTTSVSDDEDSSRVDESPSWHSIDGDEARSGRRDSDASRSTTPSSPAAAAAAATTLLQQAEELQSVLTRAHDDARTQREAEERAMRQYATQLRSLVQSFETLTRNNNNNSNNNNSNNDETAATTTAATAAAAANTSVTHAVLTSALHFVTTQQTSSDAQRSALLDTALRDGACVQELCAQLSRLRAQRDRLRGLLARAYDTIERHHLTVAEQSLLHEVVTTTATSSSPSSALDEAEGAEQLATMRAQLTALQLARQGALDELQRATDATQQLEGRLSDEARQRDVLREHVDTLTAALHASLARESALHADKVALHHRVTALAANIAEATAARATNVQSAERVEGDNNNNNNNNGDDGNKEDDVTALHDCVERMRATVDDLVALVQRNNESSMDTATLAVSSAAVRADDDNNKDDDDDDEQHALVDTVPSEEQLMRRLWCAATDTTRDAVDGGSGSGSGVLRAMVHMLRDTMVQLGLLRRALRDAALQHNNTLAHIANNFVVAQDTTTTTTTTTAATTTAAGGDGDNNATATTVNESDGTEHATVTTTTTTTTTHGADGDEDDKDDARMARLLGPTDAMRVAQLTLRARELAAQLQSTRDELAAAQRRADAADAAAHNAEAHNKRILAISKTLLEKQQALVRDNVALREQLAVYAAAAANTATAPTITTTTTTMMAAAAPPMPSTTTATTVHSEGDDAVRVTRADDTTHTQPTNADDAESTAAAPPHDDNNNNDMATGDEDDAAAAAAAASVEHDEASEQPPLPQQEDDGGVVANDVADADAAAHDTSADAPS